ncbi:transcription initiation factor TFIID subunit 9 [Toxorhynchites rutilus septentrionalis]|uniref:transcription initiation factor TFIID subunit 9 n=1 Tax=Toxorhynchites rutilus septentrionalis TaxID=329112 RepID=UPI00247AF188|nr:transcription initiation factor TFIID subunit 9 [Toxorhynchites rutilus septentrionalis]
MENPEREKTEKLKIASQVKHIPKDAQVIMSILKELGVTDYEPRVINQLLEFTYRYVTCILDDAKVFANHARKKVIELDDVKLSTQMILDKAFTSPPPRDVLLEIARNRNNTPLPLIKTHCGLRLPPDRYCLSACNYKLRAAQQAKKMAKSSFEGRMNKSGGGKGGGAGGVKRPAVQSTPKTQVVSIPKPVFKFSTTPKAGAAKNAKGIANIGVEGSSGTEIKTEIEDPLGFVAGDSESGVKRKREEDDFEIVQ